MGISVLYSDSEILAVDKPPGLSVHAAPGPGLSLLRELRAQPGWEALVPVHRLDKDASGVLLLAHTKETAARLQRRWAEALKTYFAICRGAPPLEQGVIDAPLLENQTDKPERLRNALRFFAQAHPEIILPPPPAPKTCAVHPAGRPAQTEYTVLERLGDFTLLAARPRQGRMHQIRVHLAHAGCPLAFDPLYGGPLAAGLPPRLPLHAAELSFPYKDEMLTVRAPLPPDLAAVLELLRKNIAP